MPTYIALLRAVNVGGTGKLPMGELAAMCAAESFTNVRTYIASGNVVFASKQTEPKVKSALEKRLAAYAGKPIGVIVRTLEEMCDVIESNPFPESPPNATVAIFLDTPLAPKALDTVRGQTDEEIRIGRREVYVAYGPTGIGRSKLKIPAADAGTTRNMNTIKKLAELAGAI